MPPPPETDVPLLHILLEADGSIPLESLGRSLGVSPVRAAERVEALRAAGCIIDAHPQRGVRLTSAGLGCWADYIEARHPGGIGHRLTVYRQTASTQDAARRLVASGGPTGGAIHSGHVIVADHQTAGRGRLGRRWSAEPGVALLLTAIVDRRDATLDRLALGSCCAAADAVESLTSLPVRIRWPNDLMIETGKLAGVLVETVGDIALIGVGLNVSGRPEALPPDPTSPTTQGACLAEHGPAPDRLRLLDVLLDRLDHALHHATDDQLRASWKARSCLLQRRVTVHTGGRRLTGRVIDLDPAHGLMLHVDHGGVVPLPAATTSLAADERME